MKGFRQQIWGTIFHFILGVISAIYYPKNKAAFFRFYKALEVVLPCGACCDNVVYNLQKAQFDQLKATSRTEVSNFTNRFHNTLNKELNNGYHFSDQEHIHTFNVMTRCPTLKIKLQFRENPVVQNYKALQEHSYGTKVFFHRLRPILEYFIAFIVFNYPSQPSESIRKTHQQFFKDLTILWPVNKIKFHRTDFKNNRSLQVAFFHQQHLWNTMPNMVHRIESFRAGENAKDLTATITAF